MEIYKVFVGTLKSRLLFCTILVFILHGSACKEKEQQPTLKLQMSLNSDSTAISLGKLPNFVVNELLADTTATPKWDQIFAVYEEGNELHPLPGDYRLDSATVLFIPQGGFQKGKSYLAECYIRAQPYNAKEMATGQSQLFKPQVYRRNFEF